VIKRYIFPLFSFQKPGNPERKRFSVGLYKDRFYDLDEIMKNNNLFLTVIYLQDTKGQELVIAFVAQFFKVIFLKGYLLFIA